MEEKDIEDPSFQYGTSRMIPSVINLIKNILAAAMLAMPYGVAHSGLIPGVVLCFLVGGLSAYTFGILGVYCGELKVRTYRELCEKLIGSKCGTIVDAILALFTLPLCIGYGVFVFDCLTKVLSHAVSVEHVWYVSRAWVGFCVTILVIIPICSISKLQSLTFTSIIGLCSIIYCYIFVVMDFANNIDESQIAYTLSISLWGPPSGSIFGLFPIVNIYSACFLIQYNSPQFYYELKNPTNRRFNALSFTAYGLVVLFCGSFAVLGFLRWGVGNTPGNLLLSYNAAYAVLIATSVSLLTTYPFDFDAGRRSLMSVISQSKPEWNMRKVFWAITLGLIPLFSVVSVLIDNLSFIVGINGSLFGMTVGVTIPGLLIYLKNRQSKFRFLGLGIGFLGITLSCLGFATLFVNFG